MRKAKLNDRIMIDALVLSALSVIHYSWNVGFRSHGNSEKNHLNQMKVIISVSDQLSNIETAHNIMGVMIESHLVAGT